MDYRIEELIDIPLFQELQDKLNEIYAFPSAIIDNEGTVHTATGWQDVCTKFHRVNPESAAACRASDLYILEHLAEAKPAVTYRCPHGLVDNATPIIIGGKHVANYFTGQFFLEPPDLDSFRRQAHRFGFDEHAYLDAVRKVPVWSPQKLAQYLEFIKGFTEILCGIGLKQLRAREAQRDLAEKQTALEEMSAFNAQIIACVEEGVVVYGTDLRYRVWNPFMERLSGKPAAEVVGRHPLDVFPFLESVGVLEQVKAALSGAVTPVIDFPFALPDGRSGWTSDRCSPLYGKTGEIIGVIATIRDITAAKHAEESAQQLRSQLAQAQRLEAIGRLAGGVAHDFNNMLSVLFANIDGALEGLADASPLRDDLVEIRAMASRSAEMTRQLLAFARRQPAAPRRVDLNDAVASMLRMLRRLLGEGIELVWRPSAGPLIVTIDPSQLDQILANLCVNARDATGGIGTVILETRSAGGERDGSPLAPGLAPGLHAVLSITDTGPGMTRDVQERAFEPFFSTKPVGQGTGLGLATVYGIVNQNEGAIELQSEPGHGTSFLIFLPLRSADAAPPPPGDDPESVPTSTLEATVLVVEDERAVRAVSRRILERMGCQVLEAASPREALRIAAAHRSHIDLLLSDVVMPEMTGAQLATELGRLRPGLKVLFISGYPAPLTSERGTLPESVAFLAKPFSPRDLASKVRETLAR